MDYSKIGARLKSLREKRGLSHEQVFEITRIQPSVLKGIEEGNSSVAPVFLKGFVKTYIRFLGLDPKQLLKEEELRGEEKVVKKHKKTWAGGGIEKEATEVKAKDTGKKPLELRYILSALCVCLVLAFLVWKNLSGRGEAVLSSVSSEEDVLENQTRGGGKAQVSPQRSDQGSDQRSDQGSDDGSGTRTETRAMGEVENQTEDLTGNQTGSVEATTEGEAETFAAATSLPDALEAENQTADQIGKPSSSSTTAQASRLTEEDSKRGKQASEEESSLLLEGSMANRGAAPLPQEGESTTTRASFTTTPREKNQKAKVAEGRPAAESSPSNLRAKRAQTQEETQEIKQGQEEENDPLFSAIRAGVFTQEVLLKSSSPLLIYFKADGHSTATKTLEPEIWFSIKARKKVYLRFDESQGENQGENQIGEIQIFHNGRRIPIDNSSFFEKTFSLLFLQEEDPRFVAGFPTIRDVEDLL